MTARLILKYPDSRLRGKCEDVTKLDYESRLSQWCQDIRDTMVANAGLGLAAPQIGIKKSIFAIDARELDNVSAFRQEPQDGILYFINPSISLVEKETHGSVEACLSVPGAMYKVKRSPAIEMRYITPQQEIRNIRIVGEDAVVIQHEYDHLVGKLFIDRLNPFDKNEFLKSHKAPRKEKTAGEVHQFREQKRARARAKRKN